jgi:predicted RNase H-like nuclease (RuvC/YqgF family)
MRVTKENYAQKFAQSIKYGHDQQVRAQDAEAQCQRKDEELRALRRDIKQLEKKIQELEDSLQEKNDNDVFNESLAANNELLKQMNWKLTERCGKHLKEIQKLESEIESLRGNLHTSNYLVRLMKMITVARGIKVEDDPVFIMAMQNLCQTMTMVEVDKIHDASLAVKKKINV